MKFIIEQSDEHLTPVAGLALVGEIINHTALKLRLNKTRIPGVPSPHISHGDVVTSYIGLLCQGRSDFDHIELFRDDPFSLRRWVFRMCLQALPYASAWI